MLDTLKNLCKQNKFAGFYRDGGSKFMYGRIISVNKDHIAIYMMSPNGCFDGIAAKLTDEIIRIDIDGQYSNKMQKLLSLCNPEIFEFSLDNDKIFESLLALGHDTKRVVALELLKSGYDDVVGFVVGVENGLCTVKQIDEYGFEDGLSFVKIEDITQISYASEDESRLYKLWKLNYELVK